MSGSYEEIVRRSLDEMDAGRYAGYRISDLERAFALVRTPGNWKLPVDATVPADADTGMISAAVAFYTGSEAEFVQVKGGLRVLASGYYACTGS